MTNYHIADFLIRLKNASMAGIKEVTMPRTNLILGVAKALQSEKFLDTVGFAFSHTPLVDKYTG